MITLYYFRGAMRLIYLITSCLIISISGKTQKTFEFNAASIQAYQEITRLKIKIGRQLLEKSAQQNPHNLIPVMLGSYCDFYSLFFNEDPDEYNKLYPVFEQRLDELKEGPNSSPFYLYSQAIVRIHRAGVSVKFGHLWDAGWDFRKAYLLLKENKKKFPGFSPNDLMFGALQSVIGTIPKGYKWLANILGMNGSLTEGMKTVRNYTNSNDGWAKFFFNESAFIYPYLLFYVDNKKEEALQFIYQKKIDLVNNHLLAYMATNITLNNKQIESCKSIIQNRNKSDDYLQLSIWDFQMGYAKLYHLDIQEAKVYFEQFIHSFRGNFYIKDVYQKLSWCYLLQGNMKKAEENRVLQLTKGSIDTDADKKALKDAKAAIWPNILLLKARLLNDGGYHNEAYKLLANKKESSFDKIEEKLEFSYRIARIFDDLGKDEEAIQKYLIAIKIGANRKEYFASRAAYQIGQIYEMRGLKEQAIAYYQKCIEMEDHEFKDSLDQRAKAGIARCKGS